MAEHYDIIVCGDSFCSASKNDLKMVGRRAHFSQILEDRWGYRVLNLAHGGVSNTCILWQIREATLLQPRTIVYNRTFEGRLDIMLDDSFDRYKGLRNWAYWESHLTSYYTSYTARVEDDNPRPSVISSVHQGLAENQRLALDDDQLSAVQSWLTHFFNWEMQKEMNNWNFAYWHGRMQDNQIQALPFAHERVGAVAWVFSGANTNYDSPFHTDRATQEIVAENIHQLIVTGERLPGLAQ